MQFQHYCVQVSLPRFSGDNPAVWVLQAEKYFAFHNILSKHKLSLASFYFDDIVLYYKGMQSLINIVPAALNNINTKFIVLDKGRIVYEGQQKTCLALVADETAAVHFQMWGDECDAFEAGDIIRLENGIFSYIRNNRNNHVLRAGKRGKAEKVGEFTMAYVEKPNMSEIHWVPDPKNPKIYMRVATSQFS